MFDTLTKIFNNHNNLFTFAYLFGSRAKENYTESSDLDVAVYVNDLNKKNYFDIKTDLYLQLNKTLNQNDIDIVIMNQCKNIILLNQIITHGQLLCDNDRQQRLSYEQKILHMAIDFKSQRKRVMGI